MKLIALTSVAALCAAPLAAQSCQSTPSRSVEQANYIEKMSILETAAAAGQFNTLKAAIDTAGLSEALEGEGPFTVFAPTDEAFAKLPKGVVEELLKEENREQLTMILTYHVVAGSMESKKVVKQEFLPSLNGQRIAVEVDKKKGVRFAGSDLLKADIQCENGIIHVIDSVMLPNTEDLLATAAAAGDFKTLATAVKTAGLVEALQSEGPFTVFAPTDAAFAKLPEGTIAELLKEENREQLTAILTYHVVSGRVYAKDAIAAEMAATLQGSELRFQVQDDVLWVNDARVVKGNLETSNGVIHVIDTVLLPK